MPSILIVDEYALVADLFAELFTRVWWAATTLHDGGLALEALRSDTPYDAVLVSHRVGRITGVELITQIRALPHRRHVPIVMVTGSGDLDVERAAFGAGADEVLYKPGAIPTLVEAVHKHVARGQPRRAR
jgi:CheY-like chemotaxis protein